MIKISNYIEDAKKNEVVFRLLLDRFSVEHNDLSIEEIYSEYSEGNRYGIWTILLFKEKEPNVFEFGWKNVAALSGGGSVDLYTIENNKLKYIKNIMGWRS